MKHLLLVAYVAVLERQRERVLREIIEEADFVLSGGDNPDDACPDCGLAGVGMLRDALNRGRAVLKT